MPRRRRSQQQETPGGSPARPARRPTPRDSAQGIRVGFHTRPRPPCLAKLTQCHARSFQVSTVGRNTSKREQPAGPWLSQLPQPAPRRSGCIDHPQHRHRTAAGPPCICSHRASPAAATRPPATKPRRRVRRSADPGPTAPAVQKNSSGVSGVIVTAADAEQQASRSTRQTASGQDGAHPGGSRSPARLGEQHRDRPDGPRQAAPAGGCRTAPRPPPRCLPRSTAPPSADGRDSRPPAPATRPSNRPRPATSGVSARQHQPQQGEGDQRIPDHATPDPHHVRQTKVADTA